VRTHLKGLSKVLQKFFLCIFYYAIVVRFLMQDLKTDLICFHDKRLAKFTEMQHIISAVCMHKSFATE